MNMEQWAWQIVNRARMRGDLPAGPCEGCGKNSPDTFPWRPMVAHHDDYAKPLDVRWMCRSCHGKHHAKHGPGLNGKLPAPRKATA